MHATEAACTIREERGSCLTQVQRPQPLIPAKATCGRSALGPVRKKENKRKKEGKRGGVKAGGVQIRVDDRWSKAPVKICTLRLGPRGPIERWRDKSEGSMVVSDSEGSVGLHE